MISLCKLHRLISEDSIGTCIKPRTLRGRIILVFPDHAEPFFLTYSPPELLDRHLQLGHDIHAKELSRIPIPSTQDVNWTHFGGGSAFDVNPTNLLQTEYFFLMG